MDLGSRPRVTAATNRHPLNSTTGDIYMPARTIGVIVHGATGRIGATQHLQNALTPMLLTK
jgi:hypothetical protein